MQLMLGAQAVQEAANEEEMRGLLDINAEDAGVCVALPAAAAPITPIL